MIKINNLQAHYGYVHALKGLNIDIPEGKIVTLLGANGAGKSTTLKCISGVLKPSEGDIVLDGKSLLGERIEAIVEMGIVQSPEGRRIFQALSVEENLLAGAYTVKEKDKIAESLSEVYGYFPRLEERRKQHAGTLSGGEQQMLAIGRALMSNPKMLLLDEPSLGLAPLIVKDIFAIIKAINKRGTTILLVEQNAMQALKISDYAYVLETGSIVHEGKGQDLLDDPKMRAAYLGGQ